MIHKIGRKAAVLNLRIGQLSCQLMNNGADHFQMAQFFCTCIMSKMKPLCIEYLMSQVRFARMVAVIGEPITVNSAFLYHLQKALLLALKEQGTASL